MLGKNVADVSPTATAPIPSAEQDEAIYTCPMHPQIRLPEPGDCPLCGMELVLEEKGNTEKQGKESGKEAKPAGYACAMSCVPPLPNPANVRSAYGYGACI